MKEWHVITHSCSYFHCSLTKPTLPEGNECIITYHMKPLILNVFPWQHRDGQYLRLAKNGYMGHIQIILLSCLKEVFHDSALPIQVVSWQGAGLHMRRRQEPLGWCKREVLSSRCMWRAVIRGAAYNLSNGRWRYAERPGTDQTSVSSKQAQTTWSANKTLISLELVKNLIMDICNGHGNSAEDII